MFKALAHVELVVTELWLALQAQNKFAHIFTWKKPVRERESVHTWLLFPYLPNNYTCLAFHVSFPSSGVSGCAMCSEVLVNHWWNGVMGETEVYAHVGPDLPAAVRKRNWYFCLLRGLAHECFLCSVLTSNPWQDSLEEHALSPGWDGQCRDASSQDLVGWSNLAFLPIN